MIAPSWKKLTLEVKGDDRDKVKGDDRDNDKCIFFKIYYLY